jgi:hypothetical protein
MKNPYKSYTVSDLVPMIEHVALDLMGEPIVGGKKPDGTLMTTVEVAQQNSLTAMNNAGIRLLAKVLVEQLQGIGDDDDG